jgi:hypothetical protein
MVIFYSSGFIIRILNSCVKLIVSLKYTILFSSVKDGVINSMGERIQRPMLDERQKRLLLANEALSYGRGGASLVSRILGASRTTITKAVAELENGTEIDGKTRGSGAGRNRAEENHPDREDKTRRIIGGKTWPYAGAVLDNRKLKENTKGLGEERIFVGHVTLGKIPGSMGYSKQPNRKMLQTGGTHPDRNAQFEHINKTANVFLETGEPVLSSRHKKEGKRRKFQKQRPGIPVEKTSAKCSRPRLSPCGTGENSLYGIYNVNRNEGFVNVGTSHDTSEFAAGSISQFPQNKGTLERAFPVNLQKHFKN